MRECIRSDAERLRRECRSLVRQAENLVYECWAAEDGEGGYSLRSHAEEAQEYLEEAVRALEVVCRAR